MWPLIDSQPIDQLFLLIRQNLPPPKPLHSRSFEKKIFTQASFALIGSFPLAHSAKKKSWSAPLCILLSLATSTLTSPDAHLWCPLQLLPARCPLLTWRTTWATTHSSAGVGGGRSVWVTKEHVLQKKKKQPKGVRRQENCNGNIFNSPSRRLVIKIDFKKLLHKLCLSLSLTHALVFSWFY